MNFQPLFIREVVIAAIRECFSKKKYHEVVAPILNASLPLEPNFYSFEATWHFVDHSAPVFLPTSPEAALKKMLAMGLGNCFSIAKSFRNNEIAGTQHNPEFLMLEWYQEDSTYRDVMTETQKLLQFVAKKAAAFDVQTEERSALLFESWAMLSLADLFEEHIGVSLESVVTEVALFAVAQAKGYSTDNATWSEVFDQLFINEIEPFLPQSPFFLIDFPTRISPLCKPRSDRPFLAERFEVYLAGMELGNGNTENTDEQSVRVMFEKEAEFRKKQNLHSHPFDKEFLAALRTLRETKKSYAGIGLGVDRLAMCVAGVTDIAEIEPFVQKSF